MGRESKSPLSKNHKNHTLRFILRLFTYLSFSLLFVGVTIVLIISLTKPWQTELIWMKVRSVFLVLAVILLLPAFVSGVALGFITERKLEKWLFWGLCSLMVLGLSVDWWWWH
jgi:FtsH-binding integral membrane protein